MKKKTTKKKMKRFYPRRNAELSLQFYRTLGGAPGFFIASNLTMDNFPMTSIDAITFARGFASNCLISMQEKLIICSVFERAAELIRGAKAEQELQEAKGDRA